MIMKVSILKKLDLGLFYQAKPSCKPSQAEHRQAFIASKPSQALVRQAKLFQAQKTRQAMQA